MDIVLYKNFSPANKINKNITAVATYAGTQLVEPTNDHDVSISFAVGQDVLKWDNVNYMKFDDAYYFIDSRDEVYNGYCTVHGTMDLLMTFRSAISNFTVQLDRASDAGATRRIEDDQVRMAVDSERIILEFPTRISGAEADGFYILTTSQPGYTTA